MVLWLCGCVSRGVLRRSRVRSCRAAWLRPPPRARVLAYWYRWRPAWLRPPRRAALLRTLAALGVAWLRPPPPASDACLAISGRDRLGTRLPALCRLLPSAVALWGTLRRPGRHCLARPQLTSTGKHLCRGRLSGVEPGPPRSLAPAMLARLASGAEAPGARWFSAWVSRGGDGMLTRLGVSA